MAEADQNETNVQLENGYTRIANGILEALAVTNLNGTQRRILDVVIRNTYGYRRKSHNLSISFIADKTNICKAQIQRELAKLIKVKIISVTAEATFNKSRAIGINKNYTEWLISSEATNKKPGSELDMSTGSELDMSTGSELDMSTGSELDTHINKYKKSIKENIKKEIDIFFETVWKLYPNKKGKTAVSKKSKDAIYKLGIEKITAAIESYKKELAKETWKQPMNGSTFFNGRYIDYLSENNESYADKCKQEFVPVYKYFEL